jgi:hypothetical protein
LLHDVRASLHAYVAPGQGLPFWGKRAQETIDQLRESLLDLDERISPGGGSLAESLDGIDQLTAAERRARTYVSRGEMQIAGDVIFTEIRDILAAATAQVESVRGNLLSAEERRTAALRSEQTMRAGAALALWIAIAVFLMPTQKPAAVREPGEWRNDLKETLKKPVPVTPEVLIAPTPEAPLAPQAPSAPLAPQAPSAPQAPLAPETVQALKTTAEICADLSALSDPGALEGALGRVSEVLSATGLIVWVASNDAGTLSPVATHGFDARLVARIGRIARDSSNLTAAAFRENAAKISAPTASAPGAIAVPMCSPTGPSGVLSVELKAGQPVDDAKVALAGIVAAQLATLTMPVSETTPELAESQRAAI